MWDFFQSISQGERMNKIFGDKYARLPQENELAIFGAGGHGREIAWLVRELWGDRVTLTFLVDRPEFLLPDVNGIPVKLVDEYASLRSGRAYVAAVGDPKLRERCAFACEARGMRPVTLIHPRAELSCWVTIEDGSVVCAGCVLTTNMHIGRHVHINVGCTISHDTQIADFAILSPGSHVSGYVHIGKRVFIGTGAVIINGSITRPLIIGDDAIIAAGACVTQSVEVGSLVAGVPAVRKR